jgi:hypothetical protein
MLSLSQRALPPSWLPLFLLDMAFPFASSTDNNPLLNDLEQDMQTVCVLLWHDVQAYPLTVHYCSNTITHRPQVMYSMDVEDELVEAGTVRIKNGITNYRLSKHAML